MKDIIGNIFKEKEYQIIHNTDDLLLFKPYYENRHEFWGIFFTEDLDILENQGEIFELLDFASGKDKFFEKNTSLLVVYNGITDDVVCKKILDIEEDAYFFKKYVVSYKPEQLQILKTRMNESKKTPLHFIQTRTTETNIFKEYKNESSEVQSWLKLLYQLAIKLPIININIPPAKELESLFENNNEALTAKGLFPLKEQLLSKFELNIKVEQIPDDAFIKIIESTYEQP